MTDRRDATLEELLSDPIILEYMARDGYQGDDIRKLLQQARLRNRTQFQASFACLAGTRLQSDCVGSKRSGRHLLIAGHEL